MYTAILDKKALESILQLHHWKYNIPNGGDNSMSRCVSIFIKTDNRDL